jgi:hypothetical protein
MALPTSPDPYFPVEIVPVQAVLNDQTVPCNYQAVIRTDHQKVLAIHGPEYRLVKNEEAFSAFREALDKSSLNTEGMQVTAEMAYHGARTMLSFTFPSYGFSISRIGDLVNLKLKVINSYDGTAALTCILSGHRLACLNGMIIEKNFAHSYIRHRRGFNLTSIQESLTTALSTYLKHIQQWQAWAHIPLTDSQADQVFALIPQSTEGLQKRLQMIYADEKATLGENLWSVFNALTNFSTNAPIRRDSADHAASIRLSREQRVRAVLNSDFWQTLANA